MTFYGPVSNAATDSNPVFGVVLSVAVVVFGITLFTITLLRDRAIRRGVEERGWQWIGEALPYYFPERELLCRKQEKVNVENAFTAFINGVEIICCDCILGQGRHKTYITLIGVRSASDPFGVTKFDSSYNTTHADGWFGLTLSSNGWAGSRYMSAKQVFAVIENIG